MSELNIKEDFNISELFENKALLMSTFKKRDINKKTKTEDKIEPFTLNIYDVLDYVPVNRATINKWIKIKYFPLPIAKTSHRRNLWRMSEVIEFLDKCIANKDSYKDHVKSLEKQP